MSRAAIYARVSSAAQRDAQTIEGQLRTLPGFVAAQGWILVDTYVDDGRSAKTGMLDKRDGFARLMRDAEAGRFDVLVVVDVNRLTRTGSIEERAQILGPFQRLGIRIATPSGGVLDLQSFLGEFWISIQALVAAEENRKRSEAIKRGKLRALAEGRKPAGPTPFGLGYSRAAGQWSIDEERASIVRECFRRVIAGESCKAIADDLHDRGAPTPRGPWHRHKVWQIVRSRTYVGEWTADKQQRVIVRVPALVTEREWQRAQDKLVEHGKRGLVKTKHVYLLEGLAVCGMCGSPIAIRSATFTRGYRHPAAYVCKARKYEQRGGRCTAPIVPVAEIDAEVWAIMSRSLTSRALADAVRRLASARTENRDTFAADVARYEAKLAQAERAGAAIAARFRRGLISEASFDLELAAAAKERAQLGGQLERARDAVKAHGEPQDSVESYLAALEDLAAADTPAARQRVVRALLPRGSAVFVEREVEMLIDFLEPGAGEESVCAPRSAAGSRMHHGDSTANGVRLRLVAGGRRR